MADPARRLPDNAPGAFFVDATCIDCGMCRWLAPAVFGDLPESAYVHAQPADTAAREAARRAALACPTGSIGAGPKGLAGTAGLLPMPVGDPADGVCFLGYASPDSFGAASWLIAGAARAGGGVLVDTPRWTRRAVEAVAARGGIGTIFLTHRDDVAEHARFAARFGARRVLHRDDVTAGTRDVEVQPEGDAPLPLADDLLLIPVPGHTRGSACLLYRERYLFTGDHLAFGADGRLTAFRGACWYDWRAQTRAMERLLAYRFEWVLPGHGAPGRLAPGAMERALAELIDRMRRR